MTETEIKERNKPIESKGFEMYYAGDATVGIYPQQWDITGSFSFENKKELDEFKQKLKEVWEYCSDTPVGISTYEEIEENEKKYGNEE